MASEIYKHTMNRAPSAESTEQGAGNGAASPGAVGADASRKDSGAQPLIDQRSLYVDRQVSRGSRSRSKAKKIRRLKILVALLTLGLVFVIMGWILAWAKLQKAEEKAGVLDADLRRMEIKMAEARVGAEKRESEMLSLMENRIPGLSEIVFNKLLDVNDQYLLNVTFSEVGVGEDKTLEFHAMLANYGSRMVLPQVKILLFNDSGLQVGMLKLERSHATGTVTLADLEPGETRSYHAQIPLELDAAPKYYLLDVK